MAISAAGTSGQALISGGTGTPTWFAPTQGSILFAGASGILSQNNANFFWDNTNNRLGIGVNSSLLATLDARALLGTLAVASVSGKTSFAAEIVDQSGVGDLWTASKSGATKFVITNSGNVGVGTTTPGSTLQVNGGAAIGYSAATAVSSGNLAVSGSLGIGITSPFAPLDVRFPGAGTGALASFGSITQGVYGTIGISSGTGNPLQVFGSGGDDLVLGANSTERMRIMSSGGTIGVNTSSPLGILDVRGVGNSILSGTIPVASISGKTSFASLVVDNSGVGDIFTASSSGLNRFVITQAGNVGIGTSTPSVFNLQVAGSVGPNADGSYNMGSFDHKWNYGYFNNFTAYNSAIIGSLANPIATLDVRSDNTYYPTSAIASISGSTTFAGLVVDNSGPGDLFTASSSGLNRFVIKQNGNVGVGTTTPGAPLQIGSDSSTIPGLLLGGGTNVNNYLSVSGGRAMFGYDVNGDNTNGALALNVGNQKGFELFTGGTNGTFLSGTISLAVSDTGRVGIGNSNTSPLATLDVRPQSGTLAVASISGATSFAGLVVDNSGPGDLFTASSSGLNRFVVTQNGNVGIGKRVPASLLDVNGTAQFDVGGSGGTVFVQTPNSESGFEIANTNRADIRFDDSTLKLVVGSGTGALPLRTE